MFVTAALSSQSRPRSWSCLNHNRNNQMALSLLLLSLFVNYSSAASILNRGHQLAFVNELPESSSSSSSSSFDSSSSSSSPQFIGILKTSDDQQPPIFYMPANSNQLSYSQTEPKQSDTTTNNDNDDKLAAKLLSSMSTMDEEKSSSSSSSGSPSIDYDVTMMELRGGLKERAHDANTDGDAEDDDLSLALIRNARRKTYRNKYLLSHQDHSHNGVGGITSPLQRKSAKKRFKVDRNLQRVAKKSWNLPTQTLGHYLDIKDQAQQTARKANELRKLLNSANDI